MFKILITSLFLFSSCQKTTEFEYINNNLRIDELYKKNIQDSTKFYVYKIDSINTLYLIYTKKGDINYKILSERWKDFGAKGEKIKLFRNFDFSLRSIVPDTSMLRYKAAGVLFKETEVLFEGDSILDLYYTPQLRGLNFLE